MQGDQALLQGVMEGQEKAVMTKHKWEGEWSGKELLKKEKKEKKKTETKQNRTETRIRLIIQT